MQSQNERKYHLLEEVCIVTESTLVGQRAMASHVLLKHFITSSCKVARVVRAFVWKLATVNLHMASQVILLCECDSTYLALEWTNT